ncbi:MAG: transcription antiterminator [Firmicutes bacterium]|nr:transcription antiterminator [Bacillota bacterium]
MLSDRLTNLLSLLSQDDYQTAGSLAEKLDLSTKTVRNLLKQLHSDLLDNGARIITKHGCGSKLEVYDLKKFNQLLTKNHSNIPSSPAERVQFLLEFFLNSKEYVKKEDLSDMLCVCKKTLTNDLKKAEEILNQYNITIERKPYHGMRAIGDEFQIRLCIAECIEKRNTRNSLLFDDEEKRKISLIENCIMECFEHETYAISDIAIENLIIHMYIAMKRIREGKYVFSLHTENDRYVGDEEYKLAKKCTEKIGEQFSIEFPKEEIEYLAIHLAGKKIAKSKNDDSRNIVINSKISELVKDMLEEVYQVFRIDFRNDLELIMSLGQHLVPLTVRIKYGMRMKNPILNEIRERYSLAYIMASQACVVIKQRLCKELDDDEIGYIGLSFALALERQRTQIKKKTILLVCSSGVGSARLLVFKLKETFRNYIEAVHTCDLRSVGKVDYSKFDYIFTTVPINEPVPIPVYEVNFFMNDEDIYEMRQFLKSKQKSKIAQYYPENLFFSNVDLNSKEEVIKYMCHKISKRRSVPKEFYQAVMKRERLAKTSFGNRISMPHPYKALTKDSFVCVCVLKKDILWDEDQKVRVVFLVSIQDSVSQDIKELYKVTSKLLLSENCINELISNSSYESLIEILSRLENQLGGELDERQQ